ncbi:unnamed protein product [Toxocara canis]|uniref:ANK_REP_REGION domain-containing protein n=1 Tax=Toxocara canis TaxID=6265 RepID=A0A183TWT6_TOXCA|nr:unnamed protein product [Toxocara canis]
MRTHSPLGSASASKAIAVRSSNTSLNVLMMECERWLNARIDALRMRNVFNQQNEITRSELPQKLGKRLMQFDPDETNIRGETLIIASIKYVTDRTTQFQIRYINMLVRSGCDPSRPELRQQRTPLMLACLMRNDAIAQLLIQLNVNLTAADRLGNTALMYAAIYGQSSVVAMLVNELTRRWSFDVFRAKNVMGYTAEALAKKNGRYECSRLLKYSQCLLT